MTITTSTSHKRQIIDITDQIEKELRQNGLANVFIKHTTAAITTADLDPGTDLDLLDAVEAMTPDESWRHPHDPGHFPDHLWHALIGASITIPFARGKLLLGSWQRIILIELDGPRERQVELTVIRDSNTEREAS